MSFFLFHLEPKMPFMIKLGRPSVLQYDDIDVEYILDVVINFGHLDQNQLRNL